MFHLWAISEPYLINFSTIFSSLIFYISLPRIDIFFVEKRKPKIVESKMIKNEIERGIRKILTFITSYWFHPKFSGNIISTEARPLVISNGLKLPGMTELIQNL